MISIWPFEHHINYLKTTKRDFFKLRDVKLQKSLKLPALNNENLAAFCIIA